MQSATEKSKSAIAAIASGVAVPSTESSRHIWLAAATLADMAKRAEHSAFLAMREFENKEPQSGFEFNQAMMSQLSEVKASLVFIGGLLNGK